LAVLVALVDCAFDLNCNMTVASRLKITLPEEYLNNRITTGAVVIDLGDMDHVAKGLIPIAGPAVPALSPVMLGLLAGASSI
jgi:hypothetical protein